MIEEEQIGEAYRRSLGRIMVAYWSLNVLWGAPWDFIHFSMKSLYGAALMVLVTCFSQIILLSEVTPSSFIDSTAWRGCVPIVRGGGGMALMEMWKCIFTVFLVFMVT